MATDISTALQPVITEAVISIVGLLVTIVLASLNGFIKTKLSSQHYELLQEVAMDAVHAAEQGKLAGVVDEKKAYATTVVRETFEKAGLKVTDEQLSAAIEAAVLKAFNYSEVVDPALPDVVDPAVDEPKPDDAPADDAPDAPLGLDDDLDLNVEGVQG